MQHTAAARDVATFSARVLAADNTGGGGGPAVRYANGIWVDAALRFKDAYARVAAEHFRAEARPAPFKSRPEDARLQIIQWIESATAGRIKNLLPPGSIDRFTPAVLANALYFKGVWERKFDASLTQDGAFYLPTGGHVGVPFMSSTRKQYIATRPGYKVLRLPYARGREHRAFSMYVYLPDAHDGLPNLLQELGSDPVALLESSATLTAKVPVREFRCPGSKCRARPRPRRRCGTSG
ncbi:serpin-Z1-like [Panicum miliaceum]|uniref:Serpin-Z1-like n=1 Tax=Panicum miliaceum TaxID=4540 RepID=A0A3L6SIR2_PANMI|nr:serpin-Z1-like [Panicum miliaceum]